MPELSMGDAGFAHFGQEEKFWQKPKLVDVDFGACASAPYSSPDFGLRPGVTTQASQLNHVIYDHVDCGARDARGRRPNQGGDLPEGFLRSRRGGFQSVRRRRVLGNVAVHTC